MDSCVSVFSSRHAKEGQEAYHGFHGNTDSIAPAPVVAIAASSQRLHTTKPGRYFQTTCVHLDICMHIPKRKCTACLFPCLHNIGHGVRFFIATFDTLQRLYTKYSPWKHKAARFIFRVFRMYEALLQKAEVELLWEYQHVSCTGFSFFFYLVK